MTQDNCFSINLLGKLACCARGTEFTSHQWRVNIHLWVKSHSKHFCLESVWCLGCKAIPVVPPGCVEALWAAVKGDRRASAARFYRLRLPGASVASIRAPVWPATLSATAPPLFSERGRNYWEIIHPFAFTFWLCVRWNGDYNWIRQIVLKHP